MNNELTTQAIMEAIATVEHPEIASTLTELGMVGDIEINNGSEVKLTLRLPTMGVPPQIIDFLLNSIAAAIQPIGVTGLSYDVEEMDEAAKQNFFGLAQAGWKL